MKKYIKALAEKEHEFALIYCGDNDLEPRPFLVARLAMEIINQDLCDEISLIWNNETGRLKRKHKKRYRRTRKYASNCLREIIKNEHVLSKNVHFC
jgi:hypothetical protein